MLGGSETAITQGVKMQREQTQPSWEIRSLRQPIVVVDAPNWLAALGMALAELGCDDGMERIACERLPNGQIIVNDLSHQERYTVRPIACVRVPPSRLTMSEEAENVLDWMLGSEGLLNQRLGAHNIAPVH